MYRQIIVPLDESARAEKAIAVAARLARAADGTLLLVEVVRGLAEFESGVVRSANWAPAAVEAERQAAERYLAGIAQREELAGTHVEIATYAGSVAPTLLMAGREQRGDLIVMTTRGRTGLARWALGSVAHKLVHRSSVPILLLREDDAISLGVDPGASAPTRALIPLDGSALAESALLPAVRVVAALAGSSTHPGQAAVHLVRVVDAYDVLQWGHPQGIGSATWQQALAKTLETNTTYLSDTSNRLQQGEARQLGVTVTWSVVYDQQAKSFEADVADAILRTASVGEPVEGASAPGRCQLIAMATHGRSEFSRWMMGSITERVLHASTLPMLLVGPHADAEGEEDRR